MLFSKSLLYVTAFCSYCRKHLVGCNGIALTTAGNNEKSASGPISSIFKSIGLCLRREVILAVSRHSAIGTRSRFCFEFTEFVSAFSIEITGAAYKPRVPQLLYSQNACHAFYVRCNAFGYATVLMRCHISAAHLLVITHIGDHKPSVDQCQL